MQSSSSLIFDTFVLSWCIVVKALQLWQSSIHFDGSPDGLAYNIVYSSILLYILVYSSIHLYILVYSCIFFLTQANVITLSTIPESRPVWVKPIGGEKPTECDDDNGGDGDDSDGEEDEVDGNVMDQSGKAHKSTATAKRRKKMKAPLRQV